MIRMYNRQLTYHVFDVFIRNIQMYLKTYNTV